MRRWIVAGSLAILAVLQTAPVPVAAADKVEPRIVDLRVVDGTEDWTPATSFQLRWDLRQERAGVTSVSLRLLGESLEADPPLVEMLPADEMSRRVSIPTPQGAESVAGIYTVEVWARDLYGNGLPKVVTLRVDNRPPGPALPRLDATWFRGDVAPVLRIDHPPAPLPLSGIRGYAVSLRRGSAEPPCAGADRCSAGEVDLAAGIGDDELSLGLLPEGIHVVSVVAVSNSGMRSPVAETALVRIDATRPDLSLEGSGGGWSDRPVRVLARATDTLSGMAAAGPTGPRTSIAVDGGNPTVVQGGEASVVVGGNGIHRIAAGARDAAGNARGEDAAAPPLTGVVRIDEAPPAVAFVPGTDPAAPERLEADVGDSLSGPAANGGWIAVRPLHSNGAFEPLPTRSEGGKLSARWDSDAYPRGSYEFLVTGYDAAGNVASSTARANGVPMVLANPVKTESALRFGFGGRQLIWHRCVRSGESRRCRREVIESFGRRPATRVVPYGRGVQVGGQAVSAAGAPLAGVEISLVESFDPGATATTRVTQVRTGADGTFFARLAPGPSRQVEARFGGSGVLTRSSSRGLRLGVQTAVRFRASTTQAAVGGRPVVFRGRVLHSEATIPSYGRPVQLQFRLPGMPWTEFRTVQTDGSGRFEYPYSFSDDDSRGVRFQFRASVPPQPGWPYEPAASRPLVVTGY